MPPGRWTAPRRQRSGAVWDVTDGAVKLGAVKSQRKCSARTSTFTSADGDEPLFEGQIHARAPKLSL